MTSKREQTDLLAELGVLGLASRLKRLSDCLMQDSARVYEASGLRFQSRWFPVFVYLYRRGPTSITGLAKGLGVSHPGINKIANELIEARLASPYRDRNDKRKRVLALTSIGRQRFEDIEPILSGVSAVMQSIVDEAGGDFLPALGRLEDGISRQGFHDRFAEQAQQPESGQQTALS